MNQKKVVVRSNKAQVNYLCHYMNGNPIFAAGDYKTPHGAASHNAEWAKLKEALDQLGPNRSIEQWKVCWRDQKRKARAEGGAINRARTQTGNVNVDIPDLSENSSLTLGAIGSEMAVGMGPEESPIGFTTHEPSDAPLSPPEMPTARAITQRHPLGAVRTRRVRTRTTPSNAFLNAQLEANNLTRELIGELKRIGDSLSLISSNLLSNNIMSAENNHNV